MHRLLALGLLVATASMSMGCAMCCGPHDNAYGYYGGRWQRDDLCHGRVGSVYAPAGSPIYTAKPAQPKAEPAEPNTLPPPDGVPEAKPETKPDDLSTGRPLKSVQRTRPAPRPYLPENE